LVALQDAAPFLRSQGFGKEKVIDRHRYLL
jgi:hypothetical protein